jgi:hypothetical protein
MRLIIREDYKEVSEFIGKYLYTVYSIALTNRHLFSQLYKRTHKSV